MKEMQKLQFQLQNQKCLKHIFFLHQFLRAIHEKDPNLLAESFDLHAVLEDGAKTYNGRDAINTWRADVLIAHNTTVAIQKITTRSDHKLVLEVIMNGDFKESHGITEPFTLYMAFTLASSSVIQSLIITSLRHRMFVERIDVTGGACGGHKRFGAYCACG